MRVGCGPSGVRDRARTGWSLVGRLVLGVVIAGAVMVRLRFPWIPVPYLGALIGVPTGALLAIRRPGTPSAVRWGVVAPATLITVALLPVPWMLADLDSPPGNAWRLDGRVSINGASVDPPGHWLWLTAGRPPIVAEVVRGWFDDDVAQVDLTGGRRTARPAYSEPAAAAVGLRRAGWSLETRVMIEVSDPIDAVLPARAVIARVDEVTVTTRDAWAGTLTALDVSAGDRVHTLTLDDGTTYEFRGGVFPFRRVDVMELPLELDVTVGGMLAGTLPGSWWRNLSVGSSHGLMVALVAYVHGSGEDLARGRTIAGTGKIHADGAVGSIGDLRAKATAARRAGADVLLFPAQQAARLDGFDAGEMQLVGVTSLDAAIEALRR